MNLVTLIGRLTADPELKFFSSGTAISKGTIAIDRSYKKEIGRASCRERVCQYV